MPRIPLLAIRGNFLIITCMVCGNMLISTYHHKQGTAKMLPTMTNEDRSRYLAMTHEKTKALIANLPNMKTDWLDDETWQDMARDRGLKLPAMYLLPTPTAIRRWLRRLGMTNAEFREWGGYDALEDFARLNPRWPLRALVGILLEYVSERDYARELLRGKLSAKD